MTHCMMSLTACTGPIVAVGKVGWLVLGLYANGNWASGHSHECSPHEASMIEIDGDNT